MTNLIVALLGFMFQGQAPPPMFQVTAADKAVELHDFPGGVFGRVEIARPTEIEVRAAFDIRWVDIRPRSAGIRPVIAPDHGSFRFRLDRPEPLTIEFNGQWSRVIHLFGDPPEKDPLTAAAPNVRYFGPGVHEAGLIELKDGETLYLAAGAWLRSGPRTLRSAAAASWTDPESRAGRGRRNRARRLLSLRLRQPQTTGRGAT